MMDAKSHQEYLFKVLVIGDIGTGKTSIIKRYVHNIFSQNYRATIGVDFALKVLNWNENTIIRLQLWDIAGQERFGNMTRVYYKEASGAFVVYDSARQETFDAVVKWKSDLDSKVQLKNGQPIPTVLLANKCDLEEMTKERAVELDEYCTRNNFVGWFATSAKENIGIKEAAKYLIQQIRLAGGNDGYEVPVLDQNNDVLRLHNSVPNGPGIGPKRQSCCAKFRL